jgi:hypothetical protein
MVCLWARTRLRLLVSMTKRLGVKVYMTAISSPSPSPTEEEGEG